MSSESSTFPARGAIVPLRSDCSFCSIPFKVLDGTQLSAQCEIKLASNLRQSCRRFRSPSSSVDEQNRASMSSNRAESAATFFSTALARYGNIVRHGLLVHNPGRRTSTCLMVALIPPNTDLSGGNTSAESLAISIKTFNPLPMTDPWPFRGAGKESDYRLSWM